MAGCRNDCKRDYPEATVLKAFLQDKEHLILEGEVAVFSGYVGGTCEYHRLE